MACNGLPTAIRDTRASFTGVFVQKPHDVLLAWIELEPLNKSIYFAWCEPFLDLRPTELGRAAVSAHSLNKRCCLAHALEVISSISKTGRSGRGRSNAMRPAIDMQESEASAERSGSSSIPRLVANCRRCKHQRVLCPGNFSDRFDVDCPAIAHARPSALQQVSRRDGNQ
jgi:hypothetical protein